MLRIGDVDRVPRIRFAALVVVSQPVLNCSSETIPDESYPRPSGC
jgi:hypothetical protein